MLSSLPDKVCQVNLIHISDLHFGRYHRFQSDVTPMAEHAADARFPSLAQKFGEDLRSLKLEGPVVLCCTGDFVETASIEEYSSAEKFLQYLTDITIGGSKLRKDSFFMVPGNHDVVYNKQDIGYRFQQWTEFYNRFYGVGFRREDPWEMCSVHDRIDSHGLVIITLNSSIYIEKNTPEEPRGNLDVEQLSAIERQLEALDQERLRSSVKVALVHHHPVLIPQLAEPGRGYDAIHNSGHLLSLLKRYKFHAVLHGHKHNPFTFTDDISSASVTGDEHTVFFSCAGSLGSTGLPNMPGVSNCYNLITIKYHPNGDQFRVNCATRSLNIFNEDGSLRLAPRWDWRSIKVYDRYFTNAAKTSQSRAIDESREFSRELDEEFEERRKSAYADSRGNMLVVDVKPSLLDGQAYEAICRIVLHRKDRATSASLPERVIWSAGEKFPVKEIYRDKDENFCVSFHYWGPMLVQARIYFADGSTSVQHIYAHLPQSDR